MSSLPGTVPSRSFDRAGIAALLPHRGEILFLHRLEVHADHHYSGEARWEAGEMGLRGHFPQLSIVPAVFLVEAIAQLAGAGVLASRADGPMQASHVGVLMSIRKCSFTRPVPVGATVWLQARTRRMGDRVLLVEGSVATARGSAASIDVLVGEASMASIRALMEETA